jgi:hypothetical protein
MHPFATSMCSVFELNANLFAETLEGLGLEALRARCDGATNPLLWIAGHVGVSRSNLLGVLGVPLAPPWAAQFERGARVTDDLDYPDVGQIRAHFATVSGALLAEVGRLDESALAAKVTASVPTADGTVGGCVTLFAWHEGYHVGQMRFVRRWLDSARERTRSGAA